MKRIFIAIPIEKKWEKIFEEYRDPMGDINWLKWESLSKLHVTVFFIGATKDELIPEIEDALMDVTLAQKPFSLMLEKITYAPEGERASMIWAKWKNQPEWSTLTARVKEELSYIVGEVESRDRIPHTTLARFNKKSTPPKELVHLKHTMHEGEEMQVKEVLLMENVTTASGSIFRQLAVFALQGSSMEESIESHEVVS